MNNLHKPVLLAEAIDALALKVDGYYVDATFGRGGHTQAILSHLGLDGRLLVIDRDPAAITVAREQLAADTRVIIRQGNFTGLQQWVSELGWLGQVNGILLDLGVSSPQLDDPARGFSFLQEGPLDMRMDPTQGVSAAAWLANASERDIANALYEYGQERFSRRIARAIVAQRRQQPLVTTSQLAALIASVIPYCPGGKHPATRSFQAIRIMVNQELSALEQVLTQSLQVLACQGRLVVISFHSLEDERVKQFIQYWAQGGLPPDLVVPEAQLQRRVRQLGGLLRPSANEVQQHNVRARSARCRVMEKLK